MKGFIMSNDCLKYSLVPKLTYTLERHLKNLSNYEENARRLLEAFHIIREKMTVNLKPVIMLFPHYSEHSHEHSEQIISAIEKLLGEKRIENLSASDAWMMLVCAYMHDIGMIVQGKELESDWNTPAFQQHIQNCKKSNDEEMKRAAQNVSSIEWTVSSMNWAVSVYRDVILIAAEFYRGKHPERSRMLPQRKELAQLLNIVLSSDGRIPHRIQDVIGKICFSHGISFENMLTLLEPSDSLLGYEFHPRFVSAMLCLGDLCDLDNGRFNKMTIEAFGGLTKSNIVHYYKHESVSSFVIKKDFISVNFDIQNKRIKKELKCDDNLFKNPQERELQDVCDQILLETQNWIGWMENTIKNIKLHWNDLAIENIEAFSPSISYKILVDGYSSISSKKNMRFSFSNEKAYELIESYNLYNNSLVFIRELLQNSIDALKKQLWIDLQSGRWNHLLTDLENEDGVIDYKALQPFDFSNNCIYDYYKVRITVKHKEGQRYAIFVIDDNGTGISREDVDSRIINTGANGNSDDEGEMPLWLQPTSAFGIGLHSVFAVTDSMFITTKTESDNTIYNINMHSGKNDGYVFMSIAEHQDTRFCNSKNGTRMEFLIDVSNYAETPYKIPNQIEEPCSERPESNFCKAVQQSITEHFRVSLFDIKYQFNNDDLICIKKYTNLELVKRLFEKRYRDIALGKIHVNDKYNFALGIDGSDCVLWDRTKAILFCCDLSTGEYNTGAFVCCKGVRVLNETIDNSEDSIVLKSIDYLGGNTRDILNVSRDKLSQSQKIANRTIMQNAKHYIAKIYYELLNTVLSDEIVKEWHKSVNSFIQPWLMEKSSKELPDISVRLSKYAKNYLTSIFDNETIILFLLRFSFFVLLRNVKDRIIKILSSLETSDRIQYIFNMKWMDDENELNTIIKEKTYFYDFINNSIEMFENENDQTYLADCYDGIFIDEFYYLYLNNKKDIIKSYSRSVTGLFRKPEFGVVLTTKYFSGLAVALKIKRADYRQRKVKEDNGYITNPLDLYFSVPIIYIISALLCNNIDFSSLHKQIKSVLSFVPGYNNNYSFSGKENIGDIIFSSELKIEDDLFSEDLLKYLFFLKHKRCKFLSLNSNEHIELILTNINDTKGTIEYKGNAFAQTLITHSHLDYLPAPSGYEDIAIKHIAYGSVSYKNYEEDFRFYGIYRVYLWDNFSNIREKYGERITLGDDIETIAKEIMPVSRTDKKSVLYLLRYIYHNRAFNTDLEFEEAWKKIYTSYKKFVIKVLESI